MKWMTWTGTALVPIGGLPAGPGPDPEDPKVAPPAVISLAATSPSPTELRVSWLAPADPNAGGSIDHYEVSLDGGPWQTTVQLWMLLDGLEASSTHTIAVRATNNYGLAGPPATVVATTVPASPDPAPGLLDDIWGDVVATRDWVQVEDAYATYTGHEALGIGEGDLTTGGIISSYDGQVFEGIEATYIRVRHNNVTIRGCRITGSGGTYGAYLNPTFNAPVTGLMIEYCTFVRVDNELVEADAKSAAYIFPADIGPGNVAATIRYCNFYRWGGGIRMGNNSRFEYNYFHDMQYPPEAHANAFRVHDGCGYTVARRNLLLAGRSGVMSIYFDKGLMHDITYEENLLNSPLIPDWDGRASQGSYLFLIKNGSYASQATNIQFINNYLGNEYQFGDMGGSGVNWNANGNSRAGNVDFLTGNPL